MPKGTEYQIDYIFVYSGQEIKVYFKDGNYLPDYKLVYSMEANWGYTMFILAMRQYCNVTFDNFKTYYGDDFDALTNSLESRTAEVEFSSEKIHLPIMDVSIVAMLVHITRQKLDITRPLLLKITRQ